MKKEKKRLIVYTLIAAMTLSNFSAAVSAAENTAGEQVLKNSDFQAAEQVNAPEIPITRGEVVKMLLNAADRYTPGIQKNDIIKGYEDGSLKETSFITRAEAFTMISRAFGTLQAPSGYIGRISPKGVKFSSVPEWAKRDVENLARAGVLLGTGDGDLMADAPVTAEQVKRILYRLYAYNGSSEKDDFYISVNKEEMDQMQIPPGQTAAGGSSSAAAKTNQQVNDLIREIVNRDRRYEKGSDEQKIQDLYRTLMDMESRNQMGIRPLQNYFEMVEKAQSLRELAVVQAELINSLGDRVNGLLTFYESADMKDTSQRVLVIVPGISGMMDSREEYRKFLIKQMELCGISKEAAGPLADKMMEMEESGQGDSMEEEDAGDLNHYYNIYTQEDIDRLAPDFGFGGMLKTLGYDTSIRVQAYDKKGFENTLSYLTEENLKLWKATVKITVLNAYYEYLSQDIIDMYNEAYENLGYTQPNQEKASLETTVYQIISDYLSEEIGRAFVSRYFSEDAKKDVEEMAGELIDAFKTRIRNLEWMSRETKEEAVKKLDSLVVHIGYPDVWPQSASEIKSVEDGGNAVENMASILTNQQENEFSKLRVFMVNAAANRQKNVIIFPAGILQPPFYDVNASREENLAGIGTIIAHEITHVFDDQGAQYDAQGNVRDWWTAEDHEHFQALCEKAAAFYDGREAAPGITVNGKNTLSENISDIGGMACTLDILKKMENPDYDKFFRAHAKSWIKVTSREALLENQYDEHAPNNLRINRVLSNFQEFFDAYGIQEGDGMYVAPENRITIW